MGMVIQSNIPALHAGLAQEKALRGRDCALAALSTGLRIRRAADDASGLAISEKMKAQLQALQTCSENCEDGANLMQTAECYLTEAQDMLVRMVELAEKSANGVLDGTDRSALQDEMDALCAEIDRIASTASFNGHKLLDGSQGSNGVVRVISDAAGTRCVVTDFAPPLMCATATAPTDAQLIGTAAEHLTGSARTALLAKITQKAEDAANTRILAASDGSAPAAVAVYVNAAGDVQVDASTRETVANPGRIDIDAAWAMGSADTADDPTDTALTDALRAYTALVYPTARLDNPMAYKSYQVLYGVAHQRIGNCIAEYNCNGAITQEMSDRANDVLNHEAKALLEAYNTSFNATSHTAREMYRNQYSDTNRNGYSRLSVTITASPPAAATVQPGIALQIGESSTAADRLHLQLGSLHTNTLLGGIQGFVNCTAANSGETDASAVARTMQNAGATYHNAVTVDITQQSSACAAADALRQVSGYLSDQRGQLGAQQNRLSHTICNLTTASFHITAANSRLCDADTAQTMTALTQKNVLAQAAQAMLAQANTLPQRVLSLLQL